MEKQMQCTYCKKLVTVKLVRDITNSGTSQVFWMCLECEKNASGAAKWIAHEPIRNFGIDIESIEIRKDGRADKCEVCGGAGAEWHHFAPRFLFGDEADKWPGAFLCRSHHAHWHKVVTPEMTNKREK